MYIAFLQLIFFLVQKFHATKLAAFNSAFEESKKQTKNSLMKSTSIPSNLEKHLVDLNQPFVAKPIVTQAELDNKIMVLKLVAIY